MLTFEMLDEDPLLKVSAEGIAEEDPGVSPKNRRCPGCRRVGCGTHAVCPGCRCVSCGTLACGCGPGCPLTMQSDNQSGDDFAEECRRRVNEQGDDYAADIALERGTRRASQTQQEDSDDDVADIVRERAQFVADIVRERKRALQVQREQEQDEADRSGIDLEDKNEDFEDPDEVKARALQENWALRVKREQEQDEADCSSIADGAASSSIEQPPLPHGGLHCPIGAALRSTRGPLKAQNKMIAVQARRSPVPVPKKVGSSQKVPLHKTH